MLYIVATPIGNLKEITYRAVEVLQSADLILAEDTRHSAVLLRAYSVSAPCVSYQKFNERERAEEALASLRAGKNVALISDAGMPLVSDPGSVLLRLAIEEGLPYTVVSGPCAAVTAAVLSGLDLRSFCMAGFLPDKTADRNRWLDKFAKLESTLIFYLSPHALDRDLAFLFERLGPRRAVLVREISKIYEETVRFRLGETTDFTRKGEFVLTVEGADPPAADLSRLSEAEHTAYYEAQGYSRKESMKRAASDRGVAKSVVYRALLPAEPDEDPV